MRTKKILFLTGLIFSFAMAFPQDVSIYTQKQLDSYFKSKGVNFDHHTIYVYDVNQNQKLVYAITEMNMMQAQMNTPARISIFVFERDNNKWVPKLQKFDYYQDGSFGQFGLAKDEINIFPLDKGQFIFYYEQIKDTLDGISRAWLNVFGYNQAHLYKTKFLIGETNEASPKVAQNPNLYYYWEAENYNFQGKTLDNLYLTLEIKRQKGNSPETYETKKIKVKFE